MSDLINPAARAAVATATSAPDWRKSPSVQLVSGECFYFLHPKRSRFGLLEVAHALSNLCRFTGHCNQFYSVAEHAVRVSYAVPPECALAGLHHDDAEFVLGDVSSPLKSLLPDYKAIEREVEAVIFAKFGLPAELPACVKRADRVLLRTEQRDLMTPSGCLWDLDRIEPLPDKLVPWTSADAEKMFVARHKELVGRYVR